ILYGFSILGIPQNEIGYVSNQHAGLAPCFGDNYLTDEILIAEHFIDYCTNAVDVFVAYLNEERTGVSEEIAGNDEPVAQVREITVDSVAPSVTKRFDLLWLASDVISLAVLHVAAGRGPLKVTVKLNAVRGVDVDALYLTAKSFALS